MREGGIIGGGEGGWGSGGWVGGGGGVIHYMLAAGLMGEVQGTTHVSEPYVWTCAIALSETEHQDWSFLWFSPWEKVVDPTHAYVLGWWILPMHTSLGGGSYPCIRPWVVDPTHAYALGCRRGRGVGALPWPCCCCCLSMGRCCCCCCWYWLVASYAILMCLLIKRYLTLV